MNHATDETKRMAGGNFDLRTVAGVGRAMEFALACRNRKLFQELYDLRKQLQPRVARAGATMAGDLAAIRALIGGSEPKRGRPGATKAGDLASIANVLSATRAKAKPVPVCSWCGAHRWADCDC